MLKSNLETKDIKIKKDSKGKIVNYEEIERTIKEDVIKDLDEIVRLDKGFKNAVIVSDKGVKCFGISGKEEDISKSLAEKSLLLLSTALDQHSLSIESVERFVKLWKMFDSIDEESFGKLAKDMNDIIKDIKKMF